jgi:hypothetical protein
VKQSRRQIFGVNRAFPFRSPTGYHTPTARAHAGAGNVKINTLHHARHKTKTQQPNHDRSENKKGKPKRREKLNADESVTEKDLAHTHAPHERLVC